VTVPKFSTRQKATAFFTGSLVIRELKLHRRAAENAEDAQRVEWFELINFRLEDYPASRRGIMRIKEP